MTDNETLVRRSTTRLLVDGETQGHATLLLYPDKLAAVRFRNFRIRRLAVFIAAGGGYFIPALPRSELGGLEAAVLAGFAAAAAGVLLGGPTKEQAVAKVAAGGGDVMVIPLDLVTRLETRKPKGRLGGQYLIVTSAYGIEYGFGVKLDRWSADLANVLMARGFEVRTTPQGLTATPAPSA